MIDGEFLILTLLVMAGLAAISFIFRDLLKSIFFPEKREGGHHDKL